MGDKKAFCTAYEEAILVVKGLSSTSKKKSYNNGSWSPAMPGRPWVSLDAAYQPLYTKIGKDSRNSSLQQEPVVLHWRNIISLFNGSVI